jgi:hypothetical protein
VRGTRAESKGQGGAGERGRQVEDIVAKRGRKSQARGLVTHSCNPSYSGGRDQEDCGSKPARGNSFQDSISKIRKITIQKNGWGSGSGCEETV